MEATTTDLKSFEEDHVWMDANRDHLASNYANRWIGVRHGAVVASDASLDALIQKLPDPAHTAVEFISTEEAVVVLCLA